MAELKPCPYNNYNCMCQKSAETILKAKGTPYYIKESLRAEMDGERKEQE